MGENVKTAGENAKYYQIVAGEIVRRVTADTEGARSRVKKGGDTVYELVIGSLSGTIEGTVIEESDFGKRAKITLDDIGSRMILEVSVKSGYFDSFVSKIMNVAKGDYITIKSYDFEDKEKVRRVGVSIFNNNEKVGSYYTKDNPNGMPKFPEKRTERNITVWVLDKEEFLLEELEKWNAKPKAGRKAAETSAQDEADDLPF